MISQIKTIYLVFVIVLFATTQLFAIEAKPVSGDELNQMLEKIEQNFSKVKTLKTLFTQEKNIALFSETIVSTGLSVFKSPDKLRLDFIKPFKSSLIVNNDQIFKYEFFNGSWQKLDTGNKEMMLLIMENITSWLQGRFKDPGLYDLKAFKNGNVFVLLTPKAEQFKKIIKSFELGLNSEMNGLDYITINELKNNYTKIKFHKDSINKEISDDFFEGTNNEPHPVPQW